MSLKSYIVPRIAQRLFGDGRVNKQRRKFERDRLTNGDGHKVQFFHDPSDPYSQLLEKVLPRFKETYKIEVITHLVSPPNNGAAPEREKLIEYSKMDAMRLAKKAGIDFQFKTALQQPIQQSLRRAVTSSATISAARSIMVLSGIGD